MAWLTNPIGVITDSFRLPLREALAKAKEVGTDGVQIYAVSGEMDTDTLREHQLPCLRFCHPRPIKYSGLLSMENIIH